MLKELEPIASQLREARAEFKRTLAALTDAQAAAMTTPDWSVKDTVAHLAGAERGMVRMAQRIASGENPQLPPDYSNDVYNARQVAKRKEQTVAQLLAELETSRAELMTLIETLTPNQLELRGQHPLGGNVNLVELCTIICKHEIAHGTEISAKLTQV